MSYAFCSTPARLSRYSIRTVMPVARGRATCTTAAASSPIFSSMSSKYLRERGGGGRRGGERERESEGEREGEGEIGGERKGHRG